MGQRNKVILLGLIAEMSDRRQTADPKTHVNTGSTISVRQQYEKTQVIAMASQINK